MKKWYRSKTIWFNLATLVGSIAAVGLQYVGRLDLTTEQQLYAAICLTAVVNVANLILRKITTGGIE